MTENDQLKKWEYKRKNKNDDFWFQSSETEKAQVKEREFKKEGSDVLKEINELHFGKKRKSNYKINDKNECR